MTNKSQEKRTSIFAAESFHNEMENFAKHFKEETIKEIQKNIFNEEV